MKASAANATPIMAEQNTSSTASAYLWSNMGFIHAPPFGTFCLLKSPRSRRLCIDLDQSASQRPQRFGGFARFSSSVYRNWHDVGAIFPPQWNKYRRTLYLHLWNGNAPLVVANDRSYVFVRNFGRAAGIATCGLRQNRTITNGGTVLMKVDNPVPVGHRDTSNIITAGHSTSKPGRLIAVQLTTSGSRNELAITKIQPGHFDVHFQQV